MNQITIGILAHVDAGKTTLSEALLYRSGSLKSPGRVDYKNTFLDTQQLEKERGITIISKAASFALRTKQVTLLDTPGHIDFSPETERTLPVLDYAILLINAKEGIQSHTKTLWKLLASCNVPVFIFVNKMDMEGTSKISLIKELHETFSPSCIDFESPSDSFEDIAMCDESLLDFYLENETLSCAQISGAIRKRKLFPCYFGSALLSQGIDAFLEGLDAYTCVPSYDTTFGAIVYKISHDEKEERLTHLKITGGSLKVKQSLPTKNGPEKVNQIRIYNGKSYTTVQEATAGTICCVTGPIGSQYGDAYGLTSSFYQPVLAPVITYQVLPVDFSKFHDLLIALKLLTEEDPALSVLYVEATKSVQIQVMGEIELEIMKTTLKDRFNIEVDFSQGSVVYKETITSTVMGFGHFEPLKHFAEVHLLLEPGEPNSGMTYSSQLSEDVLPSNFQNLVLDYLSYLRPIGVLTGSALTDIKVTLVGGMAHVKHTEGGDFREAASRALRQGLKKAQSLLLEPFYSFTMSVPKEALGRILADLTTMEAVYSPAVFTENIATISGHARVNNMQSYQSRLLSVTSGEGSISLVPDGYKPALHPDEIISRMAYNPDADYDHPSSSVFCHKGKTEIVPYDKVESFLKAPVLYALPNSGKSVNTSTGKVHAPTHTADTNTPGDEELREIFERTYGSWDKRVPPSSQTIHDYSSQKETPTSIYQKKAKKKKQEYLLVDGYNIIFAWPKLTKLALSNLDGAREALIEILSNYQGFVGNTLILVFDAYKLKGHAEEILYYKNLHVVFTKEAETADAYIEKTVHEIGHIHHVTIATSDGLEQIISYGAGASILSANDLFEQVLQVQKQIREHLSKGEKGEKTYFFDVSQDNPEDFIL